ncbi:hypothetical protein [Athalassotoga saccharophila]|uniref:Uncharacterized protein n=1 Tax=Athalassotoga saccharophila TaxID=1441386 RepID=A0A6N4TEK5_9BACT|nr:hypothetical protein [Athalassotoga saccharophila]BBJ29101.1 hypothetical protein ATHSA_p20011 [Athalassotoga saccharophila]
MDDLNKINKSLSSINFSDIALLWMVSFIFIYLDSRQHSLFTITSLTLKNFLETYSYSIILGILDTLLILFLVITFKLKYSGNLSIFFKEKDKNYLFQALRDIGFKRGEFLKRWPFYFSIILILVVGIQIFSSINNKIIYSFRPYISFIEINVFIFIMFLGKAVLFFAIFDYFLDILKSQKLAYVYSAIFLLITYLAVKVLFNVNITIMGILRDSFVIAPWMMIMYYWSDNSIYYSWILMSMIQTLGNFYYAIKIGVV